MCYRYIHAEVFYENALYFFILYFPSIFLYTFCLLDFIPDQYMQIYIFSSLQIKKHFKFLFILYISCFEHDCGMCVCMFHVLFIVFPFEMWGNVFLVFCIEAKNSNLFLKENFRDGKAFKDGNMNYSIFV